MATMLWPPLYDGRGRTRDVRFCVSVFEPLWLTAFGGEGNMRESST